MEWGEVDCNDGEEEEAVKGVKKSKGAAVVGGGGRASSFVDENSSSRKLKYEATVGSGMEKGLGGVGGRVEKEWGGEDEDEREDEPPVLEAVPEEGPVMRSMLKKSSKFG